MFTYKEIILFKKMIKTALAAPGVGHRIVSDSQLRLKTLMTLSNGNIDMKKSSINLMTGAKKLRLFYLRGIGACCRHKYLALKRREGDFSKNRLESHIRRGFEPFLSITCSIEFHYL